MNLPQIDIWLEILSVQLLPIVVALVGVFSGTITRVLVNKDELHKSCEIYLSYTLTGQSILVIPLTTFLRGIKVLFIGNTLLAIHLLGIAIYLTFYVLMVASYIARGAKGYYLGSPLTNAFYKFYPALLLIVVTSLEIIYS